MLQVSIKVDLQLLMRLDNSFKNDSMARGQTKEISGSQLKMKQRRGTGFKLDKMTKILRLGNLTGNILVTLITCQMKKNHKEDNRTSIVTDMKKKRFRCSISATKMNHVPRHQVFSHQKYPNLQLIRTKNMNRELFLWTELDSMTLTQNMNYQIKQQFKVCLTMPQDSKSSYCSMEVSYPLIDQNSFLSCLLYF